jgi:hypothetical protein
LVVLVVVRWDAFDWVTVVKVAPTFLCGRSSIYRTGTYVGTYPVIIFGQKQMSLSQQFIKDILQNPVTFRPSRFQSIGESRGWEHVPKKIIQLDKFVVDMD